MNRKPIQGHYVEEIIGKRSNKGNVEYLVKWHGLPSGCNSWQPVDNIDIHKVVNYESMLDDSPGRNTRGACARRVEVATKSDRPKVKQEVDDDNSEQPARGRSRTLKETQGVGRSKSSKSRTRQKSKSQTRKKSKSPHPAKGTKRNAQHQVAAGSHGEKVTTTKAQTKENVKNQVHRTQK